jgi:hypothetical protein
MGSDIYITFTTNNDIHLNIISMILYNNTINTYKPGFMQNVILVIKGNLIIYNCIYLLRSCFIPYKLVFFSPFIKRNLY